MQSALAAEKRNAASRNPVGPRRSSKTDARLVRTDRELKVALLALLDDKPFEQITIREISAKAGIHFATFYRQYASKEELLDSLAADQIEDMVALTLPILDDRKGFIALFEYVEEHRALWSSLLTGGASATMRATLMNIAARVSEDVKPVEGTIPIPLARTACVALIMESITWWLNQPAGNYSPERMAQSVEQLMQSCLLRPKSKGSGSGS